MWAVAFVVLVLVVVAVVVVVVRRPRGDDVHSVANYNHALGTLEHLSDRIGPPVVRPVRVVPVGQSGPGERVVPPVPVRGTDEFPDPDAPIVFDDARPVERGRTGTGEPTTPTTPTRADRAQRMALDSMNRRSRPGTGVMVAIALVVVFGALVIIGSQKSHHTPHAVSTTSTTARGSSGTTTTTAPRPTTTTRPPPTTLPNQFVATTTSSAGTSATYTLPHTTYQITVTGTGTCWVQVDSSSGTTVWAGEVSSGTVQNVQASGSTTVQFGTPSLTLQVDSIPVVLPTPLHTPFVATFTPSATATPGAALPASTASSTTVPSAGTPAPASTSTTAAP